MPKRRGGGEGKQSCPECGGMHAPGACPVSGDFAQAKETVATVKARILDLIKNFKFKEVIAELAALVPNQKQALLADVGLRQALVEEVSSLFHDSNNDEAIALATAADIKQEPHVKQGAALAAVDFLTSFNGDSVPPKVKSSFADLVKNFDVPDQMLFDEAESALQSLVEGEKWATALMLCKFLNLPTAARHKFFKPYFDDVNIIVKWRNEGIPLSRERLAELTGFSTAEIDALLNEKI